MIAVRDVMTKDVTTVYRNDELSLADDILRLGRIRHLPVIDEDTGELVGIVSGRDLFRTALVRALGYGEAAQRRIMKTLRVKEAMTTSVRTAAPEQSLASAGREMIQHKLGCLPVVEDGKLVGILTEADFVALAVEANEDAS